MNQFLLPIPPTNNYFFSFQQDLNILKEKVLILEKKIESLEKKKESDYLKKDDNYYII